MKGEKKEVLDGVEYKFSSDWIQTLESKRHWLLYHEQQKLMEGIVKDDHTVLEIGPGTGFCSNFLKSKGVNLTTLDIDPNKSPDIVANIVTYEPSFKWNHVLAFEVLEHIPYENVLQVLQRFSSKCDFFFLSLPINKKSIFRINLLLPFIGWISSTINRRKREITEAHHFWEVGYSEYSQKKVLHDFEAQGYQVHLIEEFDHHFYVALRSVIM